ncbi:MAG: ABC transporter ATP-binding protein/permease [Proteobacteria bacterium]|nr:ABC transporter ATP-binding protein/permease [Pseudomonadota bacterium]
MNTVTPSPDALSSRATLSVLRDAIRFVAPFRFQFAVKGVLLMISLLPLLILPWPIKIIIDHVIEKTPIDAPVRPFPFFVEPFVRLLADLSTGEILAAAVAFQLVVFAFAGSYGTTWSERDTADARLSNGHDTATRTENAANEGWSFAGGIFGLIDFRYTMRLTQAFNHHYRSRLFERIQRLPMTAFDDERIGDAVYRVMYDTPAITNACYRILLTPIAAPLNILLVSVLLAIAFGDQPILVLSALAFAPLVLIATFPLASRMRGASARSRAAGSVSTTTAEEGMANILAVQSLGGEERQRSSFDRDSWSAFGRYRSVLLTGMAAFLMAAVPGTALFLYAFLHVADGVIAGVLSTGDFALLFVYYGRIAFLCADLGALWFNLQENAAGLQRVAFLMDQPSEEDPPHAETLPPISREIRFEDVSFAYPDGTVALENVNLEARVGQMIALVGPAGAGKTTLASMIPRFHEPASGRVLADGHDVARATRESLRSQISFVFQETVLFDATVAENIRMGRPDASDAELERAAREAGAHEFIARLPLGYDTPLGRAGGKLSVGQKQRLSIARALVRRAPVLVLDEPTSALDPATERQLVESLRQARRERLVVVIAHRLSTVRAADQILFVEAGRIVERGSHDELMAREGGAYRRYVELQTRGAA